MDWFYICEVIQDLSKKNASLVLVVTFVWNIALNVRVQYVTTGIQNLSYLYLKYWECSKAKRKYKSGRFDGVSSVLKTYECWD